MKLVITEKPSVAQSIAKVIGTTKRNDGYLEGNGFIVSWCVGHLVELSAPEVYDGKYSKWRYDDLPILPDQWKYQVASSTKKQFAVLKKLMHSSQVTSVICATDAGREGELIFRLVYHQCGCKKPMERLWISSMEDEAIREGFTNLKNGTEYDALYEAALCRERADWLVGINATRLFSCLYGQTLNVGRVMTPTLAMVVMRDAAIRAFKSEPFYTVRLQMDGYELGSQRMKNMNDAQILYDDCRNAGTVLITQVERKEKQEKAPQLYDLTSLQRDANRQLGFTAQQTLDYTQSLYEKKLVTYPRTDSRFLTDDMRPIIPDLVNSVLKLLYPEQEMEISVHAEQVINSKKVTDHHAIIPTKTAAQYDISSLPIGEQAVLQLISRRLICAVEKPCKYAETQVEAMCADTAFKTKGKVILDTGWRRYVGKSTDALTENQSVIPNLIEGDTIPIQNVQIKEGQTSPPKRFTEDLLLQAMETASSDEFPDEVERKGIGTPATRAGIIEKLVQKGYVERIGDKKTKYLVSTDKGTALITVVPEQIQSPSMTAEWEEKLLSVEHGTIAGQTFMEEITEMITALVKTYEVVKGADVLIRPKGKVIGNCPSCGSEVAEMHKGWFCSNEKCKFALWKENNYFKKIGKQMNAHIAEKLVKEGKVYLKGCRSAKTGRSYNATLHVTPGTDGRAEFEMTFENGRK